MLLEILFTILVIWWILIRRWQRRGMYKLWSQLKINVPSLPIIGHAYLFLGTDEDRMAVFQKYGIEAYKTGGLLAMWQVSRIYVNISDPELAELVLKTCLEKDDVMKVSRMLLGNGSVFAPESTLGVLVNAQREPDKPFLKAFEELCKLDAVRFCQPWLHNDTLYKLTPSGRRHVVYKKELCGFIDQVIKHKRQSMEEERLKEPDSNQSTNFSNKKKTFLELLIESSGGDDGFTDLELQEEALVLVLAGTDTSAVGAAFTALLLSMHDDVQEKVYKEIHEVFGDSDRAIVADDLPRLRYLDAVIRETLRLYPPVPVIVRKTLQELPLPTGHVLPPNCGVLVNIWAINRNPKQWGDDAGEFRPERWMDVTLKHPAAFVPFSYGPRGCVGSRYAMMSMKSALATLVRQYRLRPASPVTDRHAPLRTKFDVMMKHVDNFQLRLETRIA